VAAHAKYSLWRASISKVLNFSLAIPTPEAGGAESLISGQDGKVLDLVPTGAATVGAVVADQGAIAKEKQVGIGIEKGIARVASETVEMPSVPS
jgi:hypothetical protein